MALQDGFSPVSRNAVQDEVIAEPAGTRIVVGVEEEQHPVWISGRSECRAGADVKADRLVAGAGLGGNDVVAAGLVMESRLAFPARVITVRRITNVVAKLRCHVAPICETAVNRDGTADHGWQRTHAFVAADEPGEREIVGVTVTTLHGFDVTAEFLARRRVSLAVVEWTCASSWMY